RAARYLDLGARGYRLIVGTLFVGRDRLVTAALHPALDRAALRLQAVAGLRAGDGLAAASARVEKTAVRDGRHGLVVIARPVSCDRFIVTARLIAGYRLVVTSLNILRRAALLRAAWLWAARTRSIKASCRSGKVRYWSSGRTA